MSKIIFRNFCSNKLMMCSYLAIICFSRASLPIFCASLFCRVWAISRWERKGSGSGVPPPGHGIAPDLPLVGVQAPVRFKPALLGISYHKWCNRSPCNWLRLWNVPGGSWTLSLRLSGAPRSDKVNQNTKAACLLISYGLAQGLPVDPVVIAEHMVLQKDQDKFLEGQAGHETPLLLS